MHIYFMIGEKLPKIKVLRRIGLCSRIQLPPTYKLKEGSEDFMSHDFFFGTDVSPS